MMNNRASMKISCRFYKNIKIAISSLFSLKTPEEKGWETLP